MDTEDPREKIRRYQREWRRRRRAEDPQFREREQAARRRHDAAHKDEINARARHRYDTDAAYRARKIAAAVNIPADKQRERHLKKRYGMSLQDYHAMLARQGGACAICERPFRRTPHVDHCHVTHLPRGLLCPKCNVGLGYFEDNPIFLRRAAAYVERWLEQIAARGETIALPAEDLPVGNLVRNMILREVGRPFGTDRPPPVNWLEAITRALVDKAGQSDVAAIHELFDRIAC
jgi:hypothetical protein